MDEDTLFESETTKTPSEVAALFHDLGDGLRDESQVSLRAGEHAVTVSVPSELSVEVEVERETDDEGRETTEVELELEWEGTGADAEVDAGETDADAGEADADGDAETETDAGDADQRSEAPPPDEPSSASLGRFEVYRDRADEWRWRLVHRNGNIIADSGEGYTSRQSAEKGLQSVMTNAPGAEVTTEEE